LLADAWRDRLEVPLQRAGSGDSVHLPMKPANNDHYRPAGNVAGKGLPFNIIETINQENMTAYKNRLR
jgi:hypothetical protein